MDYGLDFLGDGRRLILPDATDLMHCVHAFTRLPFASFSHCKFGLVLFRVLRIE